MTTTLTSTDLDKDRCPRCGDRLAQPMEAYVMVPKEPTLEMVERMAKGIELANNNSTGMKFSDLLRSMACMAYMEAVRAI